MLKEIYETRQCHNLRDWNKLENNQSRRGVDLLLNINDKIERIVSWETRDSNS